jgi:hypothetical protein
MAHVRNIFITALMLVLSSGLGLAQDEKFELIIDLGYTASSGVNVNPTDVGGGTIVNKVTPKSGFSYGGTFNVALAEAISVGFQFAQQLSTLEGGCPCGGDLSGLPVRPAVEHVGRRPRWWWQRRIR